MSSLGWIGVDLDGTLAHYDRWRGIDHIGEPITAMVRRVQEWLDKGQAVKVFTARVADGDDVARGFIQDWCFKHIGERLEVTNSKDFNMIELWDDRCVRVLINTGDPCCGNH